MKYGPDHHKRATEEFEAETGRHMIDYEAVARDTATPEDERRRINDLYTTDPARFMAIHRIINTELEDMSEEDRSRVERLFGMLTLTEQRTAWRIDTLKQLGLE